jgi:DMSO/TMAO reductase YedYZ molybdopterin-dependent catalytic subunit
MTLLRRDFFRLAAAGALAGTLRGVPKPGMVVRCARPENVEMPLEGFSTWITPVERFFVRSHHYTPQINLSEWRLEVAGLVAQPLRLTMEELRRFPRHALTGVLECAGNGRALYEPPMPGMQWKYGAVGNAHWAGIRLADVLRKAGVKQGAVEVLFDGADVPVGTMPEFRRTIPIRKALDPNVLLAYDMNGAALTPSHGFPLRVVAPGWAGDSWAKWLVRIEVLDREYDGFFMKTAYRHPGRPVVPGSPVKPAEMRPVASLRVKSVIAAPAAQTRLGAGPMRVHGAAWSGESPVVSVEVSTDGGRTFHPAQLGRDHAPFAWRLWETTWTPAAAGYYTLMARARDASGDSQPLVQEWNPSGYLWNVVHQVGVEVTPDLAAGTTVPPGAAKSGHAPAAPAGYRRACLVCHDNDAVEQQRLAPAQWESEVEKMVRWGATVKEADRREILKYLGENFGPWR